MTSTLVQKRRDKSWGRKVEGVAWGERDGGVAGQTKLGDLALATGCELLLLLSGRVKLHLWMTRFSSGAEFHLRLTGSVSQRQHVQTCWFRAAMPPHWGFDS